MFTPDAVVDGFTIVDLLRGLLHVIQVHEPHCESHHDDAPRLQLGDLDMIAAQVPFHVRAEVLLHAFVETLQPVVLEVYLERQGVMVLPRTLR